MNTVADFIRKRAEDHNNALFFEDSVLTYREYVRGCAERAAFILANAGDRPRHVGILLDNIPEFPLWLGACALSGATAVCLNPTRRGADLGRDIVHTECRFVISEERYLDHLKSAGSDDAARRVFAVDSPGYRDAIAPYAGAALPEVEVQPQDCFCLIFTSGTSGAPKACICSHGRVAANAEGLSGVLGLTRDDVRYIAMPLFHSNSMMMSWLTALCQGAACALRRKFSASQFLPDVRRYGVTFFNYVGKPLAYILATPEQDDDADNPLQLVFGNEASELDRKRFAERFGCRVLDVYGSTEGGAAIMPTPNMPSGALGQAMGDGTKVVDPETGTECPCAEFDAQGRLLNANAAIGEIVNLHGVVGFEGYWKNEEATSKRVRNGIYWTGDLAYRDVQGYFYFAGRDSEWMRVDGENIGTAQVERVLHRHPDVAVAAVYPVPDPRVGDNVMAVLKLRDGASFDPQGFGRFLDAQADLGTKWVPSFIRITDELPMTLTVKVIKRQLREEKWLCDEPVWWQPSRQEPYRMLDASARQRLRDSFTEHGRADLLDLP